MAANSGFKLSLSCSSCSLFLLFFSFFLDFLASFLSFSSRLAFSILSSKAIVVI